MMRASAARRGLARLRFALAPRDLAPGDEVELVCAVRYRERIDPDHLAACPAGTRALIIGLGPMPGTAGGALLRLTDSAGAPTRYWTGAAINEVRRASRPGPAG